MSLLPLIQPEQESPRDTPFYQDVAWDYVENKSVWRGGNPIFVSGAEAVKSWAHRALQTVRTQHEAFTWNYGNECDSLIGSGYTDDLKRAEAARYVQECLLINPYIEEVGNVVATFADGELQITCRVKTIYGEVKVNV